MTRRSNYVNDSASYAAVGASADANLVRFPPEGFFGFYEEVLIGMGQTRFREASDELMAWEAQRRIGLRVSHLAQEPSPRYLGIRTDETGVPAEPVFADEVSYSAKGDEYLTSGTTATLTWRFRRAGRNVRVMFTITEDRKTGFALGTLDSLGAIGETLFAIEHRADATVWATAQGFVAAPEPGWLGIKQYAVRPINRILVRSQIRSLRPKHVAKR